MPEALRFVVAVTPRNARWLPQTLDSLLQQEDPDFRIEVATNGVQIPVRLLVEKVIGQLSDHRISLTELTLMPDQLALYSATSRTARRRPEFWCLTEAGCLYPPGFINWLLVQATSGVRLRCRRWQMGYDGQTLKNIQTIDSDQPDVLAAVACTDDILKRAWLREPQTLGDLSRAIDAAGAIKLCPERMTQYVAASPPDLVIRD